MAGDLVERLRSMVDAALAPHARVVLAVSGGADSSVLLDAAAAVAPDRVAVVATFDHGSGTHASAAAGLVANRAHALGLPVVVGRPARPLARAGEDAWRRARWAFLRETARAHDSRVVTAHTRDDQVETVFLRALRGAGARGLAGLYAESPIVRPFLDVSRAEIERYVAARGLEVSDDPSNRSLAHFRNRARLELIPSLMRVRPSLPEELLALARRAAAWRRDVDAAVDALAPREHADGSVSVAPGALTRYDAEVLCILWPALAARAGAVLDRRGTRRVAQFTSSGVPGQRMPLSGGFEVVRRRDAFVLRPTPPRREPPGAPARIEVPLEGETRFGGWRFVPADGAGSDPWSARLPVDRPLAVRAWQPGDRMRAAGATRARRVKRFLADAHVPAERRAGWPVVLAGDEIVWVPGVRRGDAATDRSGRPGVTYSSERYDDVVR